MSKMRKHFLLWCWHFSELWYWWHCVVEPVMMIDLTGSLKEMSKFVLKAVFVAWNCNCKRRYRLLLKNSIKMLVVGKEHQQEKVEMEILSSSEPQTVHCSPWSSPRRRRWCSCPLPLFLLQQISFLSPSLWKRIKHKEGYGMNKLKRIKLAKN